MTPDGAGSRATLRAMALPAFVPTMLFEVGNGAVLPVVALTALHLGASAGQAAFMLALLGIGRILGDLPASWLAQRVGDHRAMVAASALAVLAFATCAVARSLLVLAAAVLVVGGATAVFYLARHSFLTVAAPVALRARVMSTLAGAHRVGMFVGPFVGAGVIALTDVRGAYVVAVVTSACTAGLLLVVGDVDDTAPPAPAATSSSWKVLVRYRRLFMTLGIGILAVGAVRAARQTVLPLWGESLHLSAEVISLVFGVAGAAEMVLFYPAGRVMDTHGRLTVAVPAMAILGAGMMCLPLSTGVVSVTLVAVVMAIGNGIGSGIMLTIGSDAAPSDDRVRFLAVWRVFGDAGNALGPVCVSALTALASLAVAIVGVGSLGLLGAAALARWTPRYSAFATRAAVRGRRLGHQQPGPRRVTDDSRHSSS
ncbi:MAG TPA: MFS transporter [Actinomycetales bacterium]|nr:MFS transporter [Actinomycetales bacterium]